MIMADHVKKEHVTVNSQKHHTPESHPVQTPIHSMEGYDASKGGVSAGVKHHGGGKIPMGKTDMSKGPGKGGNLGGSKISLKGNRGPERGKTGVTNTQPLKPVDHGAGQGMSEAYRKQHKRGPQPGSKKT